MSVRRLTSRSRSAQGKVPIMHQCRSRCLESATSSDGSNLSFAIVLHGNMHLDSGHIVIQTFLVSVRRSGEKPKGKRKEARGT